MCAVVEVAAELNNYSYSSKGRFYETGCESGQISFKRALRRGPKTGFNLELETLKF